MLDVSNAAPVATRAAVIMLLGQLSASIADPAKSAWQAAAEQASPVDTICNAMEPMYAHMKASAGDAAAVAAVLGQSAWLIQTYGFHGKQDRAAAVYQACRRTLGETVAGEDPAVDAAYAPAAAPAA